MRHKYGYYMLGFFSFVWGERGGDLGIFNNTTRDPPCLARFDKNSNHSHKYEGENSVVQVGSVQSVQVGVGQTVFCIFLVPTSTPIMWHVELRLNLTLTAFPHFSSPPYFPLCSGKDLPLVCGLASILAKVL
jgi:hypothetical protein